MDSKELIKRKGQLHGGHTQWRVADEVLKVLANAVPYDQWGYPTVVQMIVTKLTRSLFNPYLYDNWVDIQGYAELAKEDIEERAKTDHQVADLNSTFAEQVSTFYTPGSLDNEPIKHSRPKPVPDYTGILDDWAKLGITEPDDTDDTDDDQLEELQRIINGYFRS